MIHVVPLPESFHEFLYRASSTVQLPIDLTCNPVPVIQTSTMSRLGYVASAKLLVILMLLCFFTYALTNLSTTKAYLSVLPVEIHAVLPYFGSLVLNGIDGLVKYLSSVPMEFKGVTQYFTSFSINGSAGLLNYLSVAPMDSNGITSYLTSFTINSINSFLIVWIVFKWAE